MWGRKSFLFFQTRKTVFNPVKWREIHLRQKKCQLKSHWFLLDVKHTHWLIQTAYLTRFPPYFDVVYSGYSEEHVLGEIHRSNETTSKQNNSIEILRCVHQVGSISEKSIILIHGFRTFNGLPLYRENTV